MGRDGYGRSVVPRFLVRGSEGRCCQGIVSPSTIAFLRFGGRMTVCIVGET